jgi:hypothetical protein
MQRMTIQYPALLNKSFSYKTKGALIPLDPQKGVAKQLSSDAEDAVKKGIKE